MASNAHMADDLVMQAGYDDDKDSEEEEPGTSKQNGAVTQRTDRFGFLGGDQYTDPTL